MRLNQILEGDALTVLKTMPDKLVQMCVCSPPYWGLRDYGEPGQLGLESTPEEYVARMVKIFAEVRRVLRDDGTLWLNLGDSYAANRSYQVTDSKHIPVGNEMPSTIPPGLKPKDLCGIPWRVAFALQADGWYLRSDIIWSKPNPMPESVTDRPTKAHEYLFLLTKKAKYYYDADAIREAYSPNTMSEGDRFGGNKYNNEDGTKGHMKHGEQGIFIKNFSGRNRRTVWEIATQPYPEAHFATFPEKLVEPCILAGSNDRACGICGAAWERVIEKGDLIGENRKGNYRGSESEVDASGQNRMAGCDYKPGMTYENKTLGFRPSCKHDNGDSRSIILDPFMGSGTVALVALKHGRDYIGIELKPDYIAMAIKRLKPLGNKPLPQQIGIL